MKNLAVAHSQLSRSTDAAAAEAAVRAALAPSPAGVAAEHREAAAAIKRAMEERLGGDWGCVVGADYGCYVSHAERDGYISFTTDAGLVVTVFRCP